MFFSSLAQLDVNPITLSSSCTLYQPHASICLSSQATIRLAYIDSNNIRPYTFRIKIWASEIFFGD